MSADNVIPFPQREITIGGPVDDASASLCVYGEELDPEEITRILGVAPTRSHRRGDRLSPEGPPFRTGAWLCEVKSAAVPDPPDEALGRLLDRLPSDPTFWRRLTQQYEIRIFFRIGFEGWNKGFTLSAGNIQRAAVLGVRLDFDLYVAQNLPPEIEEVFKS
jgi:hypothetical protein